MAEIWGLHCIANTPLIVPTCSTSTVHYANV